MTYTEQKKGAKLLSMTHMISETFLGRPAKQEKISTGPPSSSLLLKPQEKTTTSEEDAFLYIIIHGIR